MDPSSEKGESQGSDSRDGPSDEFRVDDESRWMDQDVLNPVESGEGNRHRNLDTESQDAVPQSDGQKRHPLQPPAPIEDPFGDDGSRHAQASSV